MLSPTKASILCFPKRFEAGKIFLNILFVPREDPLKPFISNLPAGVDAPPFSEASLKFCAKMIPSLDFLPDPVNAAAPIDLPTTSADEPVTLFQELQKVFNITLPANVLKPLPKADTFIRKYLPRSYRNAFDFSHPRSPQYGVTDDAYLCALKKPASKEPKSYTTDEVSWGKVFALALRQPVLAKKLGMIYSTEVTLPAADFYKDGGWLYIDLAEESDYYEQQSLSPLLIKKYAARIPRLTRPRSLFAAVQFLVSSSPQSGKFDPLFEEAAGFDDGFANIVHCTQPRKANIILEADQDDLPPVKDLGIRIGWEDEQILEWHNRLLRRPDHSPSSTPPPPGSEITDTPLGILSYRIDVRNKKDPPGQWHSLNKAKGQLTIGDIDLGLFNGELGVEVAPVQMDGLKDGIFWLPSYFAQWDGASVVLRDEKASALFDLTDGKKMYEAVDTDKTPLKYGETYKFRVRMADMTGEGPLETDDPEFPLPSQITSCRFRRFVPPAEVRIPTEAIPLPGTEPPAEPPSSYDIFRPLLAYPNLLYTPLNDAYTKLKDDIPKARIEKREPAYPDPDVTQVKLDVMIEAPQMDTALSPDKMQAWYPLYTTTRNFPDDPEQPLQLNVSFIDSTMLKFNDPADLGSFPLPAADGNLVLPTARNIKIIVTPLCKADAVLEYFGSEETRHGRPVEIRTWCASENEPQLFIEDVPAKHIKGILLQPDDQPDNNTALQMNLAGRKEQTSGNLMSRLADALELQSNGLNLFGKPGQRIIFGCCKEIRHTLSPEHSSIRFSSKADLINQWIVAVTVTINRDWSWNGLKRKAFTIKRNGIEVGLIEDMRIANDISLQGPDRSKTTFVFFDSIDPKPRNDKFPEVLNLIYTIETNFGSLPSPVPAPLTVTLRLPVAVKPAQVPKIVSAGIALSPYERDPNGYSWTRPRRKMLWLEFEEPVNDPNDNIFVYVKAYAPDPKLISGSDPFPDPKEIEPYTDPEYIRVITPEQPDDKAGLNERQQLIASHNASDSPRHFLVPLPPGLTEVSPELLGFFVYDICVGHANIWCTAQSRYGRSIRLTGVQHPAPSLICSVTRDKDKVVMSAPFACAISEGNNLTSSPMTELWGLLYAQVSVVNGEDHRNILLGRRQMYNRGHDDHDRTLKSPSGFGEWSNKEIAEVLDQFGLPDECPLSCVVVEVFPNDLRDNDPLGAELGYTRILRTSQLEPVPEICCIEC